MTTGSEQLYEILAWETGWGVLGFNGELGHEVDGATEVQRPAIALDWNPYQLISGHVDCRIDLEIKKPAAIFGFMEGHSWEVAEVPVTFSTDGAVSGILAGPGERTAERSLPIGRHVLCMTTGSSNKTRRYPVWALREFNDTDTLRLVIPTSNNYRPALSQTLALLQRYWPNHPPIDIVHHEEAPQDLNVHTFYAGPQVDVSWCEALARYLTEVNTSELVVLLLDDYGLCQPVDTKRLAEARSLMYKDPSIGAFYLTWMMLPEAESYPLCEDVIIWPRWSYSVHTQAALWRRASLLRALEKVGRMSIEWFELEASAFFNDHEFTWEKHISFQLPAPASPSLFLDSCDKTNWPIGYHNLYTRGQPDPRHEAFLREHGLGENEVAPAP